MSYILEALKKSEQQREIGRVPGITSVHENTAKSAGSKWRWLIVAVLLLNAGLLGLLLWPGSEPEPEAVTSSAPVAEPLQVRPDRPAAVPIQRRSPAVDSPIPRNRQSADIAPRPELSAPEPATIESAPKPLAQDPAVTATVQPPAEQLPRPPVEADLAAPLSTAAADADPAWQSQALQAPRPPPAKVRTPALPVWPQIPSHLFQQLSGNLRLDVHVFSDRQQQRFVLINMTKYKEGEKLQEGPQLDEITPEGVILSFRGQQFRLQAQ
jgi:general secretion pathway protein B